MQHDIMRTPIQVNVEIDGKPFRLATTAVPTLWRLYDFNRAWLIEWPETPRSIFRYSVATDIGEGVFKDNTGILPDCDTRLLKHVLTEYSNLFDMYYSGEQYSAVLNELPNVVPCMALYRNVTPWNNCPLEMYLYNNHIVQTTDSAHILFVRELSDSDSIDPLPDEYDINRAWFCHLSGLINVQFSRTNLLDPPIDPGERMHLANRVKFMRRSVDRFVNEHGIDWPGRGGLLSSG